MLRSRNSSSFFKPNKNKKFDYKPIYFDPDNDKNSTMEERIRFGRGDMYNKNKPKLVGAFTNKENAAIEEEISEKQVQFKRNLKVALLVATLGVVSLFCLSIIEWKFTLILAVAFFIIYIKKAR